MKAKHLQPEKKTSVMGVRWLRKILIPVATLLCYAGAMAQVIPNVKKKAPSGLGSHTATVGGLIVSDGGATITESGIVYSTAPNPTRFQPGVTDTITGPVITSGSFSFNLTGLPSFTKYYYRAYAVNVAGIAYSLADSFTTHPIIQALPYLENFDGAAQTGWTSAAISGTNDWQVGTPSKTQITGSFSAPNCWVTRLTGPFSPNSNSYLLSPQFDFSNYSADPVISFYHNFSISANDMGVVAEISLDGGSTWAKLDPVYGTPTPTSFNTAISINWYNSLVSTSPSNPVLPPKWANSSNIPSYSPVNGWIRSQTRLVGAAGLSDVRVRFRIGTTSWSFTDGWAIDNIHVFPASAPQVLTLTKRDVTSNAAVLEGSVGSNGNSAITGSGVVAGPNPSPRIGEPGTHTVYTNPIIASGQFAINAVSLLVNTPYHYRAFAMNAVDTTYGADSTFTTAASAVPPSVTSQKASNIFAKVANLQGNVGIDGGAPVTASGVIFSTAPNLLLSTPGIIDSTTAPLVTSGIFSFNVAGLSAKTKYYFRAYATNSAGTNYSTIDSFTTTALITAFPYLENFDNTNTDWATSAYSGGMTDAWQKGTPAKSVINNAYSAPNSYVTGLTGNYPPNTDCVLQSPEFDFSALPADVILSFTHKMQATIMQGNDGGIVEISINGSAWSKLDPVTGTGPNFNTATSKAWYNNNDNYTPLFRNKFSGWTGNYSSQVNGWITSSVYLPGSALQANVRIRFRFATRPFSTRDEGWAIDDIRIILPGAPSAATGGYAHVSPAQATLSGTIISDSLAPITASGVVIGLSASPAKGGTGVIDSATSPMITTGTFAVDVDGLLSGTLYHYRAYTTNAVGTNYGADSTFTTAMAILEPAIITKGSSQIKATSATIKGKVMNNGGATVTASGIVYATTPLPALSGVGVTDSATAIPLNYGAFGFNPTGLVPSTKYYFRAYAQNSAGIRYSSQDSFVTAPLVNAFPYLENFDAGPDHGWQAMSSGGLNSWVIGTPAKFILNGSYSGPNAWVTGLTALYSKGENASVVSPQIDCSAQVVDPVLRFRQRFATESYDGGVVEISLDGGTTWTALNPVQGSGANFNTATSNAWYNEAAPGFLNPAHTTPVFSRQSSAYASQAARWIQSTTILTGAAGHANVRVRFRFASNTYTFLGVYEGWEIDDIEIILPTAATVITGTYSNVFVSSASLQGNVTNHGNSVISARGVVYATSPAPVRGGLGVTDLVHADNIPGTFSVQANSLAAATLYYYRAYVVNGTGIAYGSDSSFTTPATAGIPVVTTTSAAASTDYAIAKGAIAIDSGAVVTSSGFIYSTSSSGLTMGNPGVVSVSTNPLVTMGPFQETIASLNHSTKYYFRAYAGNSAGTGYGHIDSFLTPTPVTSFPYMQNFDLGSAGWSTQGINGTNNWVLGTPAKTQLSAAHSSPNAWVTRLTGFYSGYSTSSVLSPIFDFTSATKDPILRFYHNFKLDGVYDYCGALVQISLDEGATWATLDQNWKGYSANYDTDSSYAWYNNPALVTAIGAPKWSRSSTAFSSHSNGWIQSATRLSGAAGKNKVMIRFLFSAQEQPNEGWAIDDIEVLFAPTAPTTPATTVNVTPGHTTAQVSWTKGNGNARIVVARAANDPAILPVNGKLYRANAVFGQGMATDIDNYVVYNDTGSSVTITGLTPLTAYAFDVYEYNGKYMHTAFAAGATVNTTTTPVKLVSFAAANNNGDGLLAWTTASEKNNAGFNIERSVDGKRFERIGFVKGAGNSSRLLHYTYADAGVFNATRANTVYYRLKQIDKDGRSEYSAIVSISSEQAKRFEVTAYPVPFSRELNVKVTSTEEQSGTLQITDLRGVTVANQPVHVIAGEQLVRPDGIEHLEAGLYFVKITLGNQSQVIRVIKLKQ